MARTILRAVNSTARLTVNFYVEFRGRIRTSEHICVKKIQAFIFSRENSSVGIVRYSFARSPIEIKLNDSLF